MIVSALARARVSGRWTLFYAALGATAPQDNSNPIDDNSSQTTTLSLRLNLPSLLLSLFPSACLDEFSSSTFVCSPALEFGLSAAHRLAFSSRGVFVARLQSSSPHPKLGRANRDRVPLSLAQPDTASALL